MALHDEDLRATLLDLQDRYIERVEGMLEQAMERQEIRPCDARPTALLLKAMIDGIQVSFSMGVEVEVDALLTAALELVTKGLLPPE